MDDKEELYLDHVDDSNIYQVMGPEMMTKGEYRRKMQIASIDYKNGDRILKQ